MWVAKKKKTPGNGEGMEWKTHWYRVMVPTGILIIASILLVSLPDGDC